jgi:sugar (pentulose or hexulose) kinase
MDSAIIIGIDSSTQSTKLHAFQLCKDAAGNMILAGSVFATKVVYTEDFPHLCSEVGAMHHGTAPGEVTQPTELWFKALDMVLCRAAAAGVTQRAVALSLSAQQHAAVYWQAVDSSSSSSGSSSTSIAIALPTASAEKTPLDCLPLQDWLQRFMAFQHVPIWMDSSTTALCKQLAVAVSSRGAQPAPTDSAPPSGAVNGSGDYCLAGNANASGDAYLARTTGSSAYERFTLLQCVAMAQRYPYAFQRVAHVRLLSASLTSALTGCIVPNDVSDAGGMNALRLPCAAAPAFKAGPGGQQPTAGLSPGAAAVPPLAWGWDPPIVAWADAAMGLGGCTEGRAPPSIAHLMGNSVVDEGSAHTPGLHAQARYKLPPTCLISSGSGDNPCALAGLEPIFTPTYPPQAEPLAASCTVLSFGTSDTVLGTAHWDAVRPRVAVGHVMPSPLHPLQLCMTMLCVKNGGLVREQLAKTLGGDGREGDWIAFDSACRAMSQRLDAWGEGGVVVLGLELPLPEIVPHTTSGGQSQWWEARVSGAGGERNEGGACGASVSLARLSAPPDCAATRAGGACFGQLCNLALHTRLMGGDKRCVRGSSFIATGGGAQSVGYCCLLHMHFRERWRATTGLGAGAKARHGGPRCARFMRGHRVLATK